MRYLIAAMALAFLLISPADARPKQSATVFDERGSIMPDDRYPWTLDRGWRVKTKKEMARERRSFRTEREAGGGLVSDIVRPAVAAARFIRGRLVCARNVGAELEARGIKGTGSALAKSYLHWGRPSGPVPGAVAVFSRGKRGGHVAIVADVKDDGTVIYLNPSSRRQAWQVGPYHRKPIAYRVSG